MTLTKPFRRAFITLAVGALALTVAPGVASAGDYDLLRCKSGMVCLYKGSLADRDLIDSSYGKLNVNGLSANTRYYIVNNGTESPGQDHYRFQYAGSDKCLHFNVGKTLQSGAWIELLAPNYQILVDQRWGGEC
ncbi:hypothetical protein HII36_23150 [Nonomuraea sp. NN258]|uniref:hypothetical protein n=1 Tax=Nonomuraea antri TaxID=2730852 RepID=UPI001568F64C|nr:hypothetical protein [Nonomuraea antri]NRQ34707.1 hypothetical protein [Nonomuraea antri]